MKKLKTLLLAIATVGLAAFTMNANADTDATYDNTTATPTTAKTSFKGLKPEHHFLFQLTFGMGYTGNPDPVSYYDSDAYVSQYNGNLRFGFRIFQKLNYDINPALYSTDYFTIGVHSEAYNVRYNVRYNGSSIETIVSDWVSGGFSLGYQMEYSRTDLPFLHAVIMPAELVIARESFRAYSDQTRYLNTTNFGLANVNDYPESRGTISYYAGIGAEFGPVLLMSKLGYNFTQSAFKLNVELGLGF